MSVLLRLALRNALRNVRRTLLTAIAISVSLALLIVFLGLGDGVHEKMVESGVGMGLGDVLVQAAGYADDPSLDRLIQDPEEKRKRLLGLPGVAQVAPRLRSEALVSAGATSVGVELSGVDPRVEPLVSKIDTPAAMIAGHALAPPARPRAQSELPPLVLGKDLAQTLDVELGDRVTLTLRAANGGETRSGAFEVSGIFATGVHEVDAFWCETPLADTQRLSGAGDGVTMLAAFLDNVAQTPRATLTIRNALAGAPLEVLPWMQAAPELYAVIAVDEGGIYAMMAIVFIGVAAGILNTLLMSVVERTREFGVLLALGTTPRQIVAIVLTEASLLGVAATLAGLAVGLAVNQHFAVVGYDLTHWMGKTYEASGILIPKQFFPQLDPTKVAISAAVIFGLVMAGAAYPALRAARLEPVEAIRHE